MLINKKILDGSDSYRSREDISDLFQRVPGAGDFGQFDLEHVVALEDVPHSVKDGSDVLHLNHLRLRFQQRLLVVLDIYIAPLIFN